MSLNAAQQALADKPPNSGPGDIGGLSCIDNPSPETQYVISGLIHDCGSPPKPLKNFSVDFVLYVHTEDNYCDGEAPTPSGPRVLQLPAAQTDVDGRFSAAFTAASYLDVLQAHEELTGPPLLAFTVYDPVTGAPVAYQTFAKLNSNNEYAIDFDLPSCIPESEPLLPCSPWKVAEVLADPSDAAREVMVDCRLTLQPTDIVRKRLIVEGSAASGVHINCNGATITCLDENGDRTSNCEKDGGKDMIEVRSHRYKKTVIWDRPEDVTVSNCNVVGGVRVSGSGDWTQNRLSSQTTTHVATMRNRAPTRITLRNLRITGAGRIPLYIGNGATDIYLLDSELRGYSDSVAIYLDAESSRNVIRNNYIHTNTWRELIAVDGSSYNKIINNRFSALEDGGIYLYRNCGERGIIRHSTPSYNQILNNVFYYKYYKGSDPAIYIGSRDGNPPGWELFGIGDYCDDDFDAWCKSGIIDCLKKALVSDLAGTSLTSDLDHATFNVVMQNRVYARSPASVIKVQNPEVNHSNHIEFNEQVTNAPKRPAGCYVANNYGAPFVLSGDVADVVRGTGNWPVCSSFPLACEDGDAYLRAVILGAESEYVSCEVQAVDFECKVTGSNGGCNKSVGCPSGTTVVGAIAACNLESGSVTTEQVNQVGSNSVKVVRTSDRVADGFCAVGPVGIKEGEQVLRGVEGFGSVTVRCRESDDNGGDCHIKGTLFCR